MINREKLHGAYEVTKIRCEGCKKSRNPHKDPALEFYFVAVWQETWCSDCVDSELMRAYDESEE